MEQVHYLPIFPSTTVFTYQIKHAKNMHDTCAATIIFQLPSFLNIVMLIEVTLIFCGTKLFKQYYFD